MLPSPYTPHWELYPRSYVASRTPVRLIVDGKLDKPAWKQVPWSADFVEIDDGSQPAAGQTHFKALFDDDYLYVAAILHPASNLSTVAQFKERNSPIYHTDSDFEVFVDTEQSHHNYKELEINALATPWNLWLDKPYSDGGSEHSGRIASFGDPQYYEVEQQHIETRVLSGRLNTEGEGALWIAEMALSWKDLMANTTQTQRPRTLRINFSRVERQGATNWVWQPQVRWDVDERRFRGFVDMHMPDAWGYLILKEDEDELWPEQSERDPLWPAKLAATTVYYGLHAYFASNGTYTEKVEDLIVPEEIVGPMESVTIDLSTRHEDKRPVPSFKVTVTMEGGGSVSIRDDRYLQVATDPLSELVPVGPFFIDS